VSCHSAEHSSDQPIVASSFDASCICVEPAQTKAITIKSEQKRSHAEQPAVSPSSNSFAINVELTAVPQLSVPTFRDRQSIYKRLSTRSGLSRAPLIL